ncbi:MAG: DUF6428 family protein [Verrucomicrobiota bacterium]|nr:DUF6428 family protein [Verrucomicrobiota bacterium]
MKLKAFKEILAAHPEAHVRFLLPTGEMIPVHAHVTEAARIDKHFVDCGGTVREDSLCRLQTWVADDLDHRLLAGKLHRILNKAASILKSDELEVDIEHEVGFISQFPLESVDASAGEVTLRLTTRHTACLAMELCCPPASPLSEFKPLTFTPMKS